MPDVFLCSEDLEVKSMWMKQDYSDHHNGKLLPLHFLRYNESHLHTHGWDCSGQALPRKQDVRMNEAVSMLVRYQLSKIFFRLHLLRLIVRLPDECSGTYRECLKCPRTKFRSPLAQRGK